MTHTQANTNNAQPTKKRRKLSPLKIVLIILSVLPALLLIKLILILTAVPTISVDYAAQINQILKPASYDPNLNAAPHYKKASLYYLSHMPGIIGCWRDVWPPDMNDTQIDMIKDWLAVNTQALAHLDKAVSKPYYWTELHSNFIGFSRFGNTTDLLEPFNMHVDPINLYGLHQLLYVRTKFHIHQRQPQLALQHALATYKMGTHLREHTTWWERHLGIAVKSTAVSSIFSILDTQQIPRRKLELFHEQIHYEISRAKTEPDFRPDKIILYDLIQSIYTDNGRGNGYLIPRHAYVLIQPAIVTTVGPTMEMWLERERNQYLHLIWMALTGPGRRQTLDAVDKYFAYVDSIKNLTPWQLHNKGIDPEKRFEDTLENYYIMEATPWIGSHYTFEAYHRQKAEEAALITTIAILRYKADKGQLPDHIEQLVSAGYLKELPIDPYSDGLLVYKRIGDDFTLYSLGADFDDDGGTPSPWGEYWRGDDQVFWPVQRPKRRLPPKPT